MVFTLFLLGLLYTAFVVALLTAGAGVGIMLVVIVGLLVGQLFLSDRLGLLAMGAKEVTPAQEPALHAMVERLCIQADLPKPRLAIADTPVPNAFAMGRSPKNAVVCVTSGITSLLEPHELEGVLAHELTHVRNRDVLVMTIASFFATVAAMITQFGFFFGGGMGRDDNDGEGGFAVVLLASFAVYIISFFLMLSLSRYREFGADRGSALITGRPSALASALMKISGAMDRVPKQDLRAAGQMSAFFIVPASVKGTVREIFSDHPPLEKRIARLEALESQLQGAGPVA
ncbi:MAG: zinc metalloprotease HtpX [Thermoleophilaceae bacterium]